MRCPFCGGHILGRIGCNRYFCHECFHEWTMKGKKVRIFRISEDGRTIRVTVRKTLASA